MTFLEVGWRAARALASGTREVLMAFSRGEVWRCGGEIVWIDCDPEAFSPCGATIGAPASRRLERTRPASGGLGGGETPPVQPPWTAAFLGAIEQFLRDRDPAPLVGLGHGLTPAGDDFLGGYLLMRHRLGHPEVIDTTGTHEISRARLAMHMTGEGTRAEIRFVDALLGGGDADGAAAILRRHGHSSGDDFMRGARVAFDLR